MIPFPQLPGVKKEIKNGAAISKKFWPFLFCNGFRFGPKLSIVKQTQMYAPMDYLAASTFKNTVSKTEFALKKLKTL